MNLNVFLLLFISFDSLNANVEEDDDYYEHSDLLDYAHDVADAADRLVSLNRILLDNLESELRDYQPRGVTVDDNCMGLMMKGVCVGIPQTGGPSLIPQASGGSPLGGLFGSLTSGFSNQGSSGPQQFAQHQGYGTPGPPYPPYPPYGPPNSPYPPNPPYGPPNSPYSPNPPYGPPNSPYPPNPPYGPPNHPNSQPPHDSHPPPPHGPPPHDPSSHVAVNSPHGGKKPKKKESNGNGVGESIDGEDIVTTDKHKHGRPLRVSGKPKIKKEEKKEEEEDAHVYED